MIFTQTAAFLSVNVRTWIVTFEAFQSLWVVVARDGAGGGVMSSAWIWTHNAMFIRFVFISTQPAATWSLRHRMIITSSHIDLNWEVINDIELLPADFDIALI